MKILIKEGIKYIDVITVAIIRNDSEQFKMWNCPTCKNPVFQYKGNVINIVPGYAPTEIPIITQCNNCKQKYLISIVQRDGFSVL